MRKLLLPLTFILINRWLPQYFLKVLLKGREGFTPRGSGLLGGEGCAQLPALRAGFLAGIRRS